MWRRRAVTLSVGLCLIVVALVAGTRAWKLVVRPLAPERDIPFLVDALESAHPNLFFHESEGRFLHLAHVAEAELRDHPSSDAFDIIAPLVSSLGDAHTYLFPYNDAYERILDAGGRSFPFEVHRQHDAILIDRIYGSDSRITVGEKLLAVNGVPMSVIWRKLGRDISAERAELRDHFVAENLAPLLWHAGIHAPFHVDVQTGSGKRRSRALAGCTEDDISRWEATPEGRTLNPVLVYRYDPRTQIALVRAHSFSDEDVEHETVFDRGIATIRSKLRRDRPRDLLIDVRSNDGGASNLADELTSIFALHPYRDFSKIDEKSSSFLKHEMEPDDYVAIYGRDALDAPSGTIIHRRDPYTVPAKRDSAFSGRTYILIGSGTFSMAATFASAAQDAKNAIIMGRESGGLPTYFGEAHEFTLPYTGYEMNVATKHFVRGNGDVAQHGVIPTIELDESPEGIADPELRAAFDTIVARRTGEVTE